MSGSNAGVSLAALRLIREEPSQVLRLARFREQHPDVIIGTGEFGTWEARIPELAGETVTTRYKLRDRSHRLDELTRNTKNGPATGQGSGI